MRSGQPSVVVTFDPHPSEVLRPGSHPAVLSPPGFKADLLEGLGVDVLCVLPFTLDFSRLLPDEFVHEVLVDALHASAVVVGENFTYGRKAAGNVETLSRSGRTFGFSVEGVAAARRPRRRRDGDQLDLHPLLRRRRRRGRRRSGARPSAPGRGNRGARRSPGP